MRVYNSRLAPYIVAHIKEKQASGFAFVYQAYILGVFDRFVIDHGYDDGTITKSLVLAWGGLRPTEGKNYRNQRVSFVRQLALFMISLGVDAYIPRQFASTTVSVPHILSEAELKAFFVAVDSFVPSQKAYWRFSLVYPVLFRLFYCCGLRLAEGCYLKREHVDLENGLLTILHSKGEKDRLVCLSEEVLHLCRTYDEKMQTIVPEREWFFPGKNAHRPFSKTSLDCCFARFWKNTPFAAKVDKDPTIQCLRHSFVIERMNQWMLEGKSLEIMLPYLCRYL